MGAGSERVSRLRAPEELPRAWDFASGLSPFAFAIAGAALAGADASRLSAATSLEPAPAFCGDSPGRRCFGRPTAGGHLWARNFKATNIPTVTSRTAAAPNPATRNQSRFDAEALCARGGGSWRPESRERLGMDGAGPFAARESADRVFRELRAGGSTSWTSEVEASIGLRPIRGTAIRSEQLGQRTVFPANSSATRILWPALCK